MIKKISAIVLALMLCLSVVVMPTSAAGVTLGDGEQMAFAFEWDKPYYNPGDTAVLSIYMDAADDLSLYTGSFLFGLNSAVFSPDDNTQDALRDGSTTAEWFEAYYKPAESSISILAATIVSKVQTANTADENNLYDWYVKFTAAKNADGSHPNLDATLKAGFGGDEFIADEPIITLTLKVSDSAPVGSVAKAAITSGSLTCNPVQTTWKYYKTPGTATTTANIAATSTNVEKAITADEVLVTNDIVNPLKGQIRFDSKEQFDVRALAVISGDDFAEKFTDEATAAKMIKEIGFVFAAGSNVTAPTVDAAKALAESEATEADGYKKVTVGYLSSSISDGNYAFSCIVEDITDKTNSLGAVGYIKYEKDGTTYYSYYAASQTVSFETLYNTYVDLAFPA